MQTNLKQRGYYVLFQYLYYDKVFDPVTIKKSKVYK